MIRTLHDDDLHHNTKKLNNIHICLHYEAGRRVHDPLAESSMKNLGDYQALHFRMIEVSSDAVTGFAEGIEQTLKAKKQFMLFMQIGNQLDFNPHIINAMHDQLYSKDYKFIGHVLDYRNGGSFYIHPQFFIIDAEWAHDNNVNEIANSESSKIWTGHRIDRSLENYHGDYTPIWTRATNELREFKGRGLGWSIIEKLCETGAEFAPWSKEVREAKNFVYPHDSPETSLIHRSSIIRFAKEERTYLANSENINGELIRKYQHVKNIMLPASGANTFLYPFLLKSVENIMVYDINDLSLYIFEKMWNEWDGINYQKYMEENWDIWNGRLFASSHLLPQDKKNIFSYKDSWTDWWQNRRSKQIWFKNTDLFDINTWGSSINILPADLTLINISNILYYRPTSAWYSTEEKYKILNKFNQYTTERLGTGNVHFYGVDPLNNIKFLGPVQEFTDSDFIVINQLPWRKH